MRQIGKLASESDARRFAAYLLQQNIEAIVERVGDQWVIWVRNEDQRDDARAAIEQFVASPRDARYQQAAKAVELQRHESVRRAAPRVQISWRRPFGDATNRPDVVLGIIVITTLVTLGSWLPNGSISDTLNGVLQFADNRVQGAQQAPFSWILHGEFWRLITPIFLHFSLDHIVPNLFIFYYLGAQIERLKGPIALGLLMALLAIVSNSAQAHFGGPDFGGISGVVFGLLGYIWMKSSYEPDSGFVLNPLILVAAMALFIYSLFWPTKIANYAHLGGLITGIVIGITPSRRDEPQS